MSLFTAIIAIDEVVILVQTSIQYVVLGLLVADTIEWVPLCCQIIQRAAQRPYIYFVRQVGNIFEIVQEDLGSGVVDVAREVMILQQLLEVVRHADEVQLNLATIQMYSAWVDITEDDAIVVHVDEAERQLPKYRQDLL